MWYMADSIRKLIRTKKTIRRSLLYRQYVIVCVYVYLFVFDVFFLFCSISFSTLILLVGSFDL